MTTFADVLAFVRSKARISSTDTTRDADIGLSINEAYREVVGTDLWDFLRTTNTQALTAGTQDYDLPAAFDRMATESLFVYTTGATYGKQPVEFVVQPDADLWEGLNSTYMPLAARVIPGTTPGARKLRLLPNFTAVGQTLSYAYYSRLTDVSGTTTLGSPDICDAVAWTALALDKDWNRDADAPMSDYEVRARRAVKRARSSLYA